MLKPTAKLFIEQADVYQIFHDHHVFQVHNLMQNQHGETAYRRIFGYISGFLAYTHGVWYSWRRIFIRHIVLYTPVQYAVFAYSTGNIRLYAIFLSCFMFFLQSDNIVSKYAHRHWKRNGEYYEKQ